MSDLLTVMSSRLRRVPGENWRLINMCSMNEAQSVLCSSSGTGFCIHVHITKTDHPPLGKCTELKGMAVSFYSCCPKEKEDYLTHFHRSITGGVC